MKNKLVFIDGIDCCGKTTLWNKVKTSGISPRGPMSNIAYALKYNRDLEDIIENIRTLADKAELHIYYLKIDEKTFLNRIQQRVLETNSIDESVSLSDSIYFERAKNYLFRINNVYVHNIYPEEIDNFEITQPNINGLDISKYTIDCDSEHFESLAKSYNAPYHTRVYIYTDKNYAENNDLITKDIVIDYFKSILVSDTRTRDIYNFMSEQDDNALKNLLNELRNDMRMFDNEYLETLYSIDKEDVIANFITSQITIAVDVTYHEESSMDISIEDILHIADLESLEDYAYHNMRQILIDDFEMNCQTDDLRLEF